MPASNSNTEEIILQAAKKMFKQRGLDGTTVQDIATEAGTTKSMVNYYFRSKEKLFASVFLSEFKVFFGGLAAVIQADLPLKEKIEKIVEMDTNKFIEFPELPVFIVNEINRNGKLVFAQMGDLQPGIVMQLIQKQIDAEAKKGIIKKVKAEDLLLNIRSLTVFPFLAKPIIQNALELSDEAYKQKLIKRKSLIVELIWCSLTT
jgi:AcrR family transcriptional regulator